MLPHNPQCFANHLGAYAVNPEWFAGAVEAVKSGAWQPKALSGDGSGGGYAISGDGIAVLQISGPIMRGQSKYGGTSSLAVRRDVRAAVADPKVKGLLLLVDSPGGAVSGTAELALEVQAAAARKPVHAHVEGEAASAAYWAIAHASRITASPASLVGSIGVFAVLTDSSKQAELQGIKVNVVKSGAFKGAGVPGQPVTEDDIAGMQGIVDGLAAQFFAAVREGRQLDAQGLRAVNDGRILLAKDAKALGLIDAVQGLDEAVKALAEKSAKRAGRAARAEAAVKLLGL